MDNFGIFHICYSSHPRATFSKRVLIEVAIVAIAEKSGAGELGTETNFLARHSVWFFKSGGLSVCVAVFICKSTGQSSFHIKTFVLIELNWVIQVSLVRYEKTIFYHPRIV